MQSICLWTFLDAGACSWGTFSTCCHNWVCFFSVVILCVMLSIKLFLLRYGTFGGPWNVGSYNFSTVYVAVFSCAWFPLLISDPDISLFAFSLNLHFEARLGQRVWTTSISSSCILAPITNIWLSSDLTWAPRVSWIATRFALVFRCLRHLSTSSCSMSLFFLFCKSTA